MSLATVGALAAPLRAPRSRPLDYSVGIIVNFGGAPVCDASTSVNNANIMTMLEPPPPLNKVSQP